MEIRSLDRVLALAFILSAAPFFSR